MIGWLYENMTTIAVCAVIALFAVFAVISVIKNRRKGKTCSCGCEGCVYSGSCADKKDENGGKT